MYQPTDEQIALAAAWWARRLERLSFDNGDDSPQGGMATMFATLTAARHRVTAADLEAFRTHLTAHLTGLRDAGGRCPTYLGTDYAPDSTLAHAAVAAGIDTSIFPWKTLMILRDDGTVRVRDGYRGDFETVDPQGFTDEEIQP